jgi:hypothetical protein
MKCNNCNEEMEEGKAVVKATAGGFALFGLSFKHLFFKGKDKGPDQKEVILKNNHLATAFKCSGCGAVTVMPDGTKGNLVHW